MKTSLRLPLLIAATITMTGLLTSCGPENDITPASAQSAAIANTITNKPQSLPDSDTTTPQPIKKGKPVDETPKQNLLTPGYVRAYLHTVNP